MSDETDTKPKRPTIKSLTADKAELTARLESLQAASDQELSDAKTEADAATDSLSLQVVKAGEIVGTVQATLDRTNEQLTEALAQVGRLSAAKQEVIDSHRALEAEHEALLAAPPASPAFTEEPLGSVRANGLLVLAGADMVDTRWRKPQEARSAYAVDIVGPKAEFLARRTRQPYAQLADGTWRVTIPDQRQASTIIGGIKSYTSKNPDGTTASASPLASTSLQALDSCRGSNYGLVTIDGQQAMAALRGSDAMRVSVVKNGNGDFLGLLIKPS
jgi:hypothetical protein